MKDAYGVVYFIGAQEAGPVKIGFTSDGKATKRLGQLQTATHEKLVVLGTVNAGYVVEQEVHILLRAHLIRGEWFEREAALATYSRMSDYSPPGVGQFAFDLARASDMYLICEDTREKVEYEVARDLVYDVAESLMSINTEKPLPFKAWLCNQIDRRDYIGDLARDYASDPRLPSVANLKGYLEHFFKRQVRSQVTRSVVFAWMECDEYVATLRMMEERSERVAAH